MKRRTKLFTAVAVFVMSAGLAMPEWAVGGPDNSQAALQDALKDGGEVTSCHCTIPLTSTLMVSADGTQLRAKGTTFVWNGPPNHPMLVVNGAMFTLITGANFVAGKSRPSAAIEFRNAPSGPGGHPTFGNRVSQVRIGVRGARTLDYGIRFTGDVNGDSNTFDNVQISGADVAGVSMQNPQAVANEFEGLWVFDSSIGFQARAKDSAGNAYGPFKLQGRNWGFGNITVADLDVGPNAGIDVTGFYSEGGRRMINSSGGGVTVRHGYWQRGTNAVPVQEGVVVNNNTGGYRSWLRMEDFDFTVPTWPPPGEKILGWPAEQRFLHNVTAIS